MKQKLKPETWVGIFLIAGILMILGVILSFGGLKTTKEQTYPINIIFKDSAGLIKDSQIRLGGVSVGKVTKAPELLPSGNEVMLEVSCGTQNKKLKDLLEASIQRGVKIQVGSVFRIDMQNILGDKYIEIVPPSPPTDQYIQPHETIMGQAESDISKLKNNAVVASEEILAILKRIEKNSGNIDEALLNISEAAKGLSQTTKIINESLLDKENLQYVKGVLMNMDKTGKELPGLMEENRTSVAAMKETIRNARKIIDGVESRLEGLDPAIKEIPSTLTALRKASDHIASVTADARKNQGFLGLLLYDARFRANAQEFIRNLRDYGILRYRNPNEPQIKADPRGGFSGSRR